MYVGRGLARVVLERAGRLMRVLHRRDGGRRGRGRGRGRGGRPPTESIPREEDGKDAEDHTSSTFDWVHGVQCEGQPEGGSLAGKTGKREAQGRSIRRNKSQVGEW